MTASIIPQSFVYLHGGAVGENHVLLVTPEREDAVASELIVDPLNSNEANAPTPMWAEHRRFRRR